MKGKEAPLAKEQYAFDKKMLFFNERYSARGS